MTTKQLEKMERLKILTLILLMQITSIIIHLITLAFAPVYILGAIFWEKGTFNMVMDRLYKNTANLNF